RDLLIPIVGVDGLWANDQIFTQHYLPDYIRDHPEAQGWKVHYDSRGSLQEPHMGRRIGVGTGPVDEYIAAWAADFPEYPEVSVATHVPTCGPHNRYRFVLFLEKEGFEDQLKAARIQGRFHVALLSTKGFNVPAARPLH